jgi:hypothetical protein
MVKIDTTTNTLWQDVNLSSYSFALCNSQLEQTNFRIRIHAVGKARPSSQHPLKPYSMSNKKEKIEFLFSVPGGAGLPTTYDPMVLKVVAPDGYVFSDIVGPFDFIYKMPYANSTEPTIPSAEADWPGLNPLPEVSQNVLYFRQAEFFEPNKVYGFQVSIQVPDTTVLTSINGFYAGFFFPNSTCFAAGVAQTAEINAVLNSRWEVKALINAKVDYETNVEGRANNLIYTLETTNLIPPGGYIEIVGPPGFVIQTTPGTTSCMHESAPADRDAPYEVEKTTLLSQPLPGYVTCEVIPATSANVTFRLKVGVGMKIEPGRYRWQIAMKNPNSVVRNNPAPTDCGFDLCWFFASYTYQDEPLEYPTSTTSFRINTKMVQATIVGRPEMTWEQWAGSGRNNRPTHLNPLVFTVSLGQSALNAGTMTIRAPAGYVFREDCLEDLDTRGDVVFGGQPLVTGMSPWVPEVIVRSCRGDGPDAQLLVDPGVSLGLLPNKRYPFRLNVFENPRREATPNTWFVDYNGESSIISPIEGFRLWTFHRTSVLPVTKAFSTPVTGAKLVLNPVTFTIRPHNRAAGQYMKIIVTAPPTFSIVKEMLVGNDVGKCQLLVQPVSADYISLLSAPLDQAPMMNFNGPPALIWGQADFDCAVNLLTPQKLEATVLASTRELMANRDYQITVFVNNPTTDIAPELNEWKIETSTGPSETGALPTFRDEVILPGFQLNNRATDFLIVNLKPGTDITFTKGQERIPGLYFQFKFGTKLIVGDVIRIKAPSGFFFNNSASTDCPGFVWELGVSDSVTLPKTEAQGGITCVGDEMIFDCKDQNPTQGDKMVGFRIDTQNPPKTPHVMENFWKIYHESSTGMIRASGAYQSWDIYPQFKNVQIIIVGEDRAAGSQSSIAISFIPVSDADELKVIAKSPVGFSFTGAVAASPSHEVIETDVSMVRIRCAIYADLQADVRISNMKLGSGGGPTIFDLETRLGNGMMMDSTKDFTVGSFRLPGKLTVSNQSLLSVYQQNPEEHDVTSKLGLRLGETGLAFFTFSFTEDAQVGTLLRLRSPLYKLFGAEANSKFKLELVASPNVMKMAPVISVSGGELIARLDHKLYAGSSYQVEVEVITPSGMRNAADAMWSIDIVDGGTLPVNTNDAKTMGFALVDKISFGIVTGQAPPMAQVSATLNFDPRTNMPKKARIIAPEGFNFTHNCLQEPGDNNELVSCALSPETISGRAIANLVFSGKGLATTPTFMQIKIITPSQNQAGRYANSWFIQLMDEMDVELGWGEDQTGVQVMQMLNSGVIYPAIPEIEGNMAFRFTTNKKVDPNGQIECGYPDGFVIKCNGGFLKKVSLKGYITCQNFPNLRKFVLTMARPLPPGNQAFAVSSTPPFKSPADNRFYIMIRSPEGLVMDAAMTIPGLEIQPQPKVAGLDLFWSASEPERASTVGLGFELLSPLPPENPKEYKLPIMYEAVITVPVDFQQTVQKLSHIEVMQGSLPMPIDQAGTWLVNTDPKRLRIFFDEKQTKTLATGRYRWTFPVFVPARLPAYNVFLMTICSRMDNSTGANSTCNGPLDERALVTFPYPGFNLFQQHPGASQYSMTGASFGLHASMRMMTLIAGIVAWCGLLQL